MTASAPNLASCYQEVFTVAARLRSKKAALGDSAVFRTQVRHVLQEAELSAARLKYSSEDIKEASFATLALLDETILNSSNPAFRDWAQKPLMLDIFGTLKAGEACFEHMRTNMNRTETKSVIDLLEVHYLCLSLGFRGKYSGTGGEQVRAWKDPMVEKILRFRGGDAVVLSHNWLPETAVDLPVATNTWTHLALSCCLGIFALCLLLSIVYFLILSRGAADLAALVGKA